MNYNVRAQARGVGVSPVRSHRGNPRPRPGVIAHAHVAYRERAEDEQSGDFLGVRSGHHRAWDVIASEPVRYTWQ